MWSVVACLTSASGKSVDFTHSGFGLCYQILSNAVLCQSDSSSQDVGQIGLTGESIEGQVEQAARDDIFANAIGVTQETRRSRVC